MIIKYGIFTVLVLLNPASVSGQLQQAASPAAGFAFISGEGSNRLSPGGYLGSRVETNLQKRLLTLDLESILAPYRDRPGIQEWVGEHVGKFLHAAALEFQHSGNKAIKERMDYAATELIKTQLPDGYLGTYLKEDRWTSWDVWSHKYNMIGLLAYYEVTGYKPALASCEKMASLLVATFGKGRKDIIASGTHVGMAPTSVLEPIAGLYQYTGKKKYLDFSRYLVASWEQQHGPKILSALLKHGNVYKTANGKAYEMLSNLVGLLELYRVTANDDYLKAVKNAWDDIKTNRLYIHGTASHTEHFTGDNNLRPDGYYAYGTKYCGPGEGCVTVTWMQMNLALLKLTGEQKYIQELENSVYNALLPAQSPVNGKMCYFLPLMGRKRFGEVDHGIGPDICCCSSSIPRGMALIPGFTAGTLHGNPALMLYAQGEFNARFTCEDKKFPVKLAVTTDFPVSGKIMVKLLSSTPLPEAPLLLNVPAWADGFVANTGGASYKGKPGSYLSIQRAWKNGDTVTITIDMPFRIIADNNKNSDLTAVKRGPQLLAVDGNVTDAGGLPQWGWQGYQLYQLSIQRDSVAGKLLMVPFADAGQSMADYKVLLPEFEIIGNEEADPLGKYREQLNDFRNEFRAKDMPDGRFFLFGMGNRPKFLYKNGTLQNALTGEILRKWPVKRDVIIPNNYWVEIETLTDVVVAIVENENGVFIKEGYTETLVDGTDSPVNLPSFEDHRYSEILKVLHHEILINIVDSWPVPNFLVYNKPWRRDGAMMAMCLEKTGNLSLIRDWVMGLNDPYDRNNAGETEADNLGQTLYLLSLFTDKNHALVAQILKEAEKYEIKDQNGIYIKGRSDFHETPVYQSKWLKFGLRSLGLKDKYTIPEVPDDYSSLFWWNYRDAYAPGTVDAYDAWKNDDYPYIGWAADHFHHKKRNPISSGNYPLTWEINASQADYAGMSVIGQKFVEGKNAMPHTWHAAEVFLYLLDEELN